MSERAKLDDSAAAALWMLALERDPSREHMGALYEKGGINRTNTVTRSNRGKVGGKLSIPPGSLRALFHNHPKFGAGDTNQAEFTGDDKNKARQLRVPSYISAGNAVMRFDPATGRTTEVLAQFPIEEFLQFITAKRARENPIAAAIIAEHNGRNAFTISRR